MENQRLIVILLVLSIIFSMVSFSIILTSDSQRGVEIVSNYENFNIGSQAGNIGLVVLPNNMTSDYPEEGES